MKAFILNYLIGSFALDGKGRIIDCEFFPPDPREMAERIRRSEKENIDEEVKLQKRLGKNCECERVEDYSHPAFLSLKEKFRGFALKKGWISSEQELNSLIARTNVILSSASAGKVGRDKIVIQTVRLLDEADTDLNNMAGHMREWYGMYFPELTRAVGDHQRFLRILSKTPDKKDIKEIKSSSGMPFGVEDLEQVRKFSKSLLELHKSRERLSAYVSALSEEIMPNTSAVAGPILAARLVSLAGGLERMAKMPSSKIQLLGAEKALFRHLRGKGKAPKYGVLFSNANVQQAPKTLKGKVARLIASRVSMAAKVDHYSGKDRSASMKKEMKRKLNNILGGN